jgi:hypothetical protein
MARRLLEEVTLHSSIPANSFPEEHQVDRR